jgi:hypothetical protein
VVREEGGEVGRGAGGGINRGKDVDGEGEVEG